MIKRLTEILLFCFLFCVLASAQENKTDSLYSIPNNDVQFTESTKLIKIEKRSSDSSDVKKFKPDPVRSIWMGAIIPGYGQIANRSYWKLPIVYAGFLGCAYAIRYTSKSYESYRSAYIDINDDLESTNSFLDILPPGVTVENYPNGINGLKSNLATYYQQTRRYRDLSVIVSVLYYGLTLLEAYVDAQLFDFDISTDLSLHIRPSLIDNRYGASKSAGFQLSLNLK